MKSSITHTIVCSALCVLTILPDVAISEEQQLSGKQESRTHNGAQFEIGALYFLDSFDSISSTLEGHVVSIARLIERRFGIRFRYAVSGALRDLEKPLVFQVKGISYLNALQAVASNFGYQLVVDPSTSSVTFHANDLGEAPKELIAATVWLSKEVAKELGLAHPLQEGDVTVWLRKVEFSGEVKDVGRDKISIISSHVDISKISVIVQNAAEQAGLTRVPLSGK